MVCYYFHMTFISLLLQRIQGTGDDIRKRNTLSLYWVWEQKEGDLCPPHCLSSSVLAASSTPLHHWPPAPGQGDLP